MRWTLLLALCAGLGAEGPGIVVPWEEFKGVYREHIELELREALLPEVLEDQVYSIDEARYTLSVAPDHARGEVLITGRLLSGGPVSIAFLDPDLILSSVNEIAGATLLSPQEGGPTRLLPERGAPEFQVAVGFLVPSTVQGGIRSIDFPVPPAIHNALRLELPEGVRLIQAPGIQDGTGAYHFSAVPRLQIRYAEQQAGAAVALPEIDLLSRVSVQGSRVLISTLFLPVREQPDTMTLQVPAGAQLVAATLRPGQIVAEDAAAYRLMLPAGDTQPFTLDLAVEVKPEQRSIAFLLPFIADNRGRQGRFVVEDPDDGQVVPAGEGLVARIPAEHLDAEVIRFLEEISYYMSLPPDRMLSLEITRFQAFSTPTTVLDSQYLYSSFDENGGSLSVLVLNMPPDAGPRLTLKPVPDSEIWSLTVNGAKKQAYADEQGAWMIPLDSGKPSRVELAFLRKAPKLGLQGKLEVSIPATGLASQDLRVGLALPQRVEVQSVEGPVNAVRGEGWELPREIVGKPHFFSQAFYKGEGMTLFVTYKEPVNRVQSGQGGES